MQARPDFESPDVEAIWLEIHANNLCKQELKPQMILTGDLNADPTTRHGESLKAIAEVTDLSM